MLDLVHHDSWMAPPELMERLFEAIGRGVAGSVGGSVGVDIARMTVFAAIAVGLFLIGRQVVRKATGEGFLLPADQKALVAAAEASDVLK